MVNNTDLAVRAAVDGLGIAYTLESMARPFLRSGQLVRVLEDWSPSFEGLFLYYPGHRQVPAALRALIDMIRTTQARREPCAHSRTLSRSTERIGQVGIHRHLDDQPGSPEKRDTKKGPRRPGAAMAVL
jgi:hypothetical protein